MSIMLRSDKIKIINLHLFTCCALCVSRNDKYVKSKFEKSIFFSILSVLGQNALRDRVLDQNVLHAHVSQGGGVKT